MIDNTNDEKPVIDNTNDIKYDKLFLKKLNKISKNKIIKEKSKIGIQCNIESNKNIKNLIYFLIFFCGFLFGVKLTLM